MLSDFQTVRRFIGVPSTDNTQDAKIQLLTQTCDAAIKNYCKQNFENMVYTEFPFRLGGEAIVLEQTPVLSYRLTGNTTNGQAQIRGLSSTANLLVGMPVLQAIGNNSQNTQPFPNAVTIQSVDSASQVTLTGNATESLTGAQFLFGLAMWLDVAGEFGDGVGNDPSGPFGSNMLLRQGLDFSLQCDQPDGTSKSGKLTRLASVAGALGLAGNWSPYGSAWSGLHQRGTLYAPLPPLWPKWPPGSLKVVYAAGLGQGALPPAGLMPPSSTIPADLTLAVNSLAAWCWRNADSGLVQYQNESFQGYSGQLAMAVDALKQESEIGSVRQLLSRYRKVSM